MTTNGASYPSVVIFSQLGELNSSLGVSEPRYMLEVTYSMHIVFWERLLNTSEVEVLVNCTAFKRILLKVEHPYGSPGIRTKRQDL